MSFFARIEHNSSLMLSYLIYHNDNDRYGDEGSEYAKDYGQFVREQLTANRVHRHRRALLEYSDDWYFARYYRIDVIIRTRVHIVRSAVES